MGAWRLAAASAALAACYDPMLGAAGDASADDAAGVADTADVPSCGWSYLPANVTPCDFSAAGEVVVTADATLNLDACGSTCDVGGTIVEAKLVTRPSMTPLLVLAIEKLTISSGADLTIAGAPVLILLVAGDVIVESKSTIAANRADDPPGCEVSMGGDAPDGGMTGGGGGGGGFATAGGTGGLGAVEGKGGAGGSRASGSWFEPLRGGCPGGDGADIGNPGGAGGGGGGALQISARDRIVLDGRVRANGGGGQGGAFGSAGSGAGGGGSGGGILLEAPTVDVNPSGSLCVIGGSGGEGGSEAAEGVDGAAGVCTGAVTSNADPFGGDGGASATVTTQAEPGGMGTSTGGAGGGGGGGLGYLRIRSTTGSRDGAFAGQLDEVAL